MEARKVTSVELDHNGHVKRLVNDHGEWPPQACSDVIADLENGICSYFVAWAGDSLPVQTHHDSGHVRLVARVSPYGVDQLLQLPRAETTPPLDRPQTPRRYGHLGD
ncbi:hypothetical protein [Frondihabitans sp. PAMC 28766]|uniref:hypothetical protein n=1 Tax=Frondihabitans sp. PAMC 28766 TaxID=1795630 RepID=UPI0012FF813C|nr:hypothetical protein [Frondihabitans sp. PAMC 28766]